MEKVAAYVLTDDEDFLELIDIMQGRRRPKIYRERPNHFEIWTNEESIVRFRLPKDVVRIVLSEIEEQIASNTNRNQAVPPDVMLLVTLRFYATGSLLMAVGDFCGIEKSTTSRIIYKVSRAIAQLRPQFITFPETHQEILIARQEFYNISRFPRCIGAVDCTHIKIQSPGGNNAEVYRNRKGFFSYNVQVICNANLKILNVVARWPGSSHDSTIFNNSTIRAKFENGEMGDSLLVGDSGYPVKSYLITPLTEAATPAEQLFNESQIRTRNPIERCFGVWKRRFPILALGIRLHVSKVEAIVIATAVLHNIACDMHAPEPPQDENIEEAINFGNNVDNYIPPARVVGVNNAIRHSLIHDYFERLL